ncbi:MAG TPA: response regulator [Terracidiphilus sp.]|jgi:DNA-binding response OmpR family regulator|nr:response regulator [Terracidiphilus sp.]
MSPKNNFPTVPLDEVPASQTVGRAHRPSILVVDDESSIADTLAEILNRSGYAARAAYDAESALETAMLAPPEMIISDVVLPDMNGIDLAITIRRIFPECKIILFSGQASTADLLVAAKSNGHNFVLLNKPVHPTDLLARISAGLKNESRMAALAH